MGIAVGALLSPISAGYARELYLALGGTLVWGDFWGGGRVLCAFLVLGVPAFLMGGTLPAVVRAVESAQDVSRRSVGLLYGVNTIGAVVGALLATFVCFEWFGLRWTLILFALLNGVWRASAMVLVGWAVVAALLAVQRSRPPVALGSFVALGVGSLFLLQSSGPSVVWCHQPIGARRYRTPPKESPNKRMERLRELRRSVVWEKDGQEASVALQIGSLLGYSQMTNGKSDGNIVSDGPTTVLLGMLGTLLHKDAKRMLVIGLGTGMSAGWAAEAPTTQHVDVFEMEPSVFHLAKACRSANFDVMKHPKVKMYQGDARELLILKKKKYEVIVSEPSNPYRAGVLSLFTKDYYHVVKQRLSYQGIFVQWLQAYEIEAEALQVLIATVREVFPFVEIWSGTTGDLILVGHLHPPRYEYAALEKKLRHPAYRLAQRTFWGSEGVESLFSAYVAGPALAELFWRRHREQINTDDRIRVEYQLIRAQALAYRSVSGRELLNLSIGLGFQEPPLSGGTPWTPEHFFEMRSITASRQVRKFTLNDANVSSEAKWRAKARASFQRKDFASVRYAWSVAPKRPTQSQPMDLLMEAMSFLGDRHSEGRIKKLESVYPIEALLLRSLDAVLQQKWKESTIFLKRALLALQNSPWVFHPLALRVLEESVKIAQADASLGREIFFVLLRPFSGRILDRSRRHLAYRVAYFSGFWDLCVQIYEGKEENTLWTRKQLEMRALCYKYHKDKRYEAALDALRVFQQAEAPRLADGFVPQKTVTMPPRPRFLVKPSSVPVSRPPTTNPSSR